MMNDSTDLVENKFVESTESFIFVLYMSIAKAYRYFGFYFFYFRRGRECFVNQ
jgi:hypothetical protein